MLHWRNLMQHFCLSCNKELNNLNWSKGKQKKSWYICNDCHWDKYKKYRKNNPFRERMTRFNKRFGGNITIEQLEEIWKNQNSSCNICKTSLDINGKYCLDHVISRNNKGPTTKENLQFLCEKCNIGKFHWTTEEYIKHCILVAKINNPT